MRTFLLPTAQLLALGLLSIPSPAAASIFGEENATLGAILVQAKSSLDSINQQLKTARATYEDVHRYAGYADDALKAYDAARRFNLQSQAFQRALSAAFPDGAAIERDAASGGFWRGTGELGRLTRYCLDQRVATPEAKRFERCVELEDAVTAQQVRANLEKTFGGAARTPAQKAADDAAAATTAKAQAAAQAAAVTRKTVVPPLADQCASSLNAAACQAASNAATIAQLDELARVNEQLAEANRLQAVRVQQENARRKSEADALDSQSRTALEAFGQATAPAPRIDFNALQETR